MADPMESKAGKKISEAEERAARKERRLKEERRQLAELEKMEAAKKELQREQRGVALEFVGGVLNPKKPPDGPPPPTAMGESSYIPGAEGFDPAGLRAIDSNLAYKAHVKTKAANVFAK